MKHKLPTSYLDGLQAVVLKLIVEKKIHRPAAYGLVRRIQKIKTAAEELEKTVILAALNRIPSLSLNRQKNGNIIPIEAGRRNL